MWIKKIITDISDEYVLDIEKARKLLKTILEEPKVNEMKGNGEDTDESNRNKESY